MASSNKIGILDPEGKKLNPFTGEKYSDNYKKLAKMWSNLPAYKNAKEIIDDIEKHQVILLISGTGSGKTVLTPKYLSHVFNYEKKIAVTLPKQTITEAQGKFGADTLDVKLGEEVGYQYKDSPKSAKSDKTKILYATDGTIKSRLMNDPNLSEFQGVIIDEAHERKIQIDQLLYFLKETLKNRKDFKLIIMSATIDTGIFENYYKDFKLKVLNVSGRANFPVKSEYLSKKLTYDKIIEKGFEILLKILEEDDLDKPGSHDIIFFITSSNEAFKMCKKLNKKIKEEENSKCKITCKGNIFCIEMYANIHDDKKIYVQDREKYKTSNNYRRKVVFSTPAAESSLTIDGIKYVIDSGHELSSSYEPETRAHILKNMLISKAQVTQRKGRTGRTESGTCYHLYTEDDFNNNMKPYPDPDIRKSDITNECLDFINFKSVQTIENLIKMLGNFIEPPREKFMVSAITLLQSLGAIDDSKITKIGEILVSIPLNNPILSSILLLSYFSDCFREIKSLISFMDASKENINEIFHIPRDSDNDKINEKLLSKKKKFHHPSGDHISLLNIMDNYFNLDSDKREKWCMDNMLSYKILLKSSRTNWRLKSFFSKNNSTIQTVKDELSDHSEIIKKREINDRILFCFQLIYEKIGNIARSDKSDNKIFYLNSSVKDDGSKIKIAKSSFINLSPSKSNVFYNKYQIIQNHPELNIVSVYKELK